MQEVNVSGTVSDPHPISSEPIQSSLLGPLPFPLYINGILHIIRHGIILLFADYIKSLYTFPHVTLKLSYVLQEMIHRCLINGAQRSWWNG